MATWAPIKKEDEYKLDVFVDKCSVEIFLDGGKIAMTNLIFPTEPYNRMCFYSKGGTFAVDSFSAVSYTHLDVYKRQGKNKSKFSPTFSLFI